MKSDTRCFRYGDALLHTTARNKFASCEVLSSQLGKHVLFAGVARKLSQYVSTWFMAETCTENGA
jgi:hypothetical protein